MRLILDGTAAGVRADGQKMLLAIKSMGGEGEAAWRALLDVVRRGLRTPERVVVDGAPGLEKALAALWPDMAVQRCTVHYADLRIMPTSAAKPAWEAVIAVKEAA